MISPPLLQRCSSEASPSNYYAGGSDHPSALSVYPPLLSGRLASVRHLLGPALLGLTCLVPVIFYDQRYILDLGILVLTYVMLGWGLNIVVGLAGLLDLGYVAFLRTVGAYSYALLAKFGLPFLEFAFTLSLRVHRLRTAWSMGILGVKLRSQGIPCRLLGACSSASRAFRLKGDYRSYRHTGVRRDHPSPFCSIFQNVTGGPNGTMAFLAQHSSEFRSLNIDDGLAAWLAFSSLCDASRGVSVLSHPCAPTSDNRRSFPPAALIDRPCMGSFA